ncbi:MAG: hypothetical protein WCF57_22635 [Pyrinomonadaceae bacterium]
MRTKVSIVLLVALLGSILMLMKLSLSAQEDKPSLPVALQILRDDAEFIYDLGYDRPNGRKWRLESAGDCVLVWTTDAPNEALYSTGNSYIDDLRRKANETPTSVTLSLADININSIKGSIFPASSSNQTRDDYRNVYLAASQRRNVIKWRGAEGNHDDQYLTIKFKSSEKGARYAQALRDAVSVCGKAETDEEPYYNNNASLDASPSPTPR